MREIIPDCEFCGETMTPGDRCGVEDCETCQPEWICEACGGVEWKPVNYDLGVRDFEPYRRAEYLERRGGHDHKPW